MSLYIVGCRSVEQLGGLFRGYPQEVPLWLLTAQFNTEDYSAFTDVI